jgi:UDP-GlcNAc:undecaprenyl-phosphate GlcNAc-1-phosphate transferase
MGMWLPDPARMGMMTLGAIAGMAVTVLLQWLLQPVAHRLDLLDHPRGRKDHAHPTPVTGGLAMMVAAIVTTLALGVPLANAFYGYFWGSLLLIVVGLADDRHDLAWWVRIPAQVVAALLMVYVGGVRVEHIGPLFGLADTALGMWSVPLTVFATVGLINAINMIDGADGLAGMLVLTALLMLCAAALYSGNQVLALRLGTLSGVVAGFLAYNLRLPWRARAHVFMGNAGSAFLGFTIAWAVFRLTQDPNHEVSPVLALWLLPIPVMDTLVLIVRRLKTGRSPFAADRNHIHHLMQDAGFGPTRAALWLSAFSAVVGYAAAEAMRLDVPESLLLAAYVGLCLGWYAVTARHARALAFLRRLRGRPTVAAGAASR